MTNRRLFHRTAGLLASWIFVCAASADSQQDPLSRAKDFYASAEYEEALTVLETLKGKTTSTEPAAYQVFCLVALGRRDEARGVIESIVRTDPLYRPSETLVAPRIRTFFDEVRKPLLPEVARQSYAKAKKAFDQKDWAPAVVEFDRAIALLVEVGLSDAGTADLHTVATGFRDLARAAIPPPAPKPEPTVTPVVPTPPVRPAPSVYGPEHADVTRPVAISKRIPDWRPNAVEARMDFSGEIELLVNEDGKVVTASILESVHPRYDGPLIEAAKTWTFKPAMKNGVAVKYQYSIVVRLERIAGS